MNSAMSTIKPPRRLCPAKIADVYEHRSIGDAQYLQMALESGLSGTSSIVDSYERKIASFYQVPYATAVSSGAAAVSVALAGVDWERGDEVIVPPSCPICTVLPILERGLRPVFCDVRRDQFGLDPELVKRTISARTRAIIEVPMWGYPTSIDELQLMAKSNGLPLILDLAHCHASRLKGQWLAQFGDIACFSTHDCKYLSTGEGGFVLTSSKDRAEKMRSYTRFGDLDGKQVGLNYKLGGLQAAIGLARFDELKQQLTIRLINHRRLMTRISNPHVRELPIVAGGEINGYALLLQAVKSDGRHLVEYLVEHGIPSDIHKYDNKPLYEYPILSGFRRSCQNAAELLRSLTTVPLHPGLSEEQLTYMADVINDYQPRFRHDEQQG